MDTLHIKNKTIFKNSIPVAVAYLLIGFTFGALFSAKGGSAIEALVISIFCFAGAAQFFAIEFYSEDFSIPVMFFSIFILNIRHIFYGVSFLNNWKAFRKFYLFMSLTDENLGMSSLYKDKNPSEIEWVKIFALNHFYWILGCTLGSLVPSEIIHKIVGADFALIALFVAIFANTVRKRIDFNHARK